jgi:hypothetical protein
MWTEEELVRAGARKWQKDDMLRWYFPILELLGLRVTRYKTGNIQAAWINGERISNNSARELIYSYYNAKLWYDEKTQEMHWKGMSREDAENCIQAARRLANGEKA